MYNDNRNKILVENNHSLHNVSLLATASFALLLFISLSAGNWREMRPAYIIVLTSAVLFAVLSRYAIPRHLIFTIPAIYIFFLITLLFAAVNTVVTGSAAMLAALLFAFPSLIIDKSWRVGLTELIFVACFSVHNIINYTPEAAADSILNCAAFGALGFLTGRSITHVRLRDIENQRLLILQRDYDILTGLPNRRKMFSAFEALEARTSAHGNMGLMMIDIDFFKNYNDTYGHQRGDLCLRQIGECFSSFSESNKVEIYRFGGEEFLAIADGCDYKRTGELAKQLHDCVLALSIPNEGCERKTVSISVGYSEAEACSTANVEKLIAYADAALYCSKDCGRSCVTGSLECDKCIRTKSPVRRRE